MTRRDDARVLVVGAGLAGSLVAAGLREAGWAGELTLVGDEAHPPYHRPPLSKGHLAAEAARQDLTLREATYWERREVTLVLGDAICDLGLSATGEGVARTASGARLGYDRLVLATGAVPRSLPLLHGLTGVHHLRSITDADLLRPRLVAGAAVVIIGAGFIGLEVAATARANGATVTVLEVGDRVLNRVVGPETAAHVTAHHEQAGIDIRCGVQVSDVRAEAGRVTGLVLADGVTLAADVVVLGIGADPVTDLAANAGLTVRSGIVVDHGQRASDGHTLAVGDCSVGWGGVPTRLESVDHATQSAAVAVATLLGTAPDPSTPPWFWSDQGALKLQVVGLREASDSVVVRAEPDARKFAAIYLRDGVVVAAETIGAPAEFMRLRQVVAAGGRVDPVGTSALQDGSASLKSVVVALGKRQRQPAPTQ